MTLTLEHMPLDELPDADQNPRVHDSDTLGDSFTRFGYVDPCLIDERTGKLLEGHGRKHKLIELRDSGAAPPEGITLAADGTWLVPVIRGKSTADDDEARALLIALNRITERSSWEPEGLASMLDSLSKSDGGLVGVGYAPDDLTAMLDSLHNVREHERRDPDQPPVDARFVVLVECKTEPEQRQLLDRLMGEGYDVKALLS